MVDHRLMDVAHGFRIHPRHEADARHFYRRGTVQSPGMTRRFVVVRFVPHRGPMYRACHHDGVAGEGFDQLLHDPLADFPVFAARFITAHRPTKTDGVSSFFTYLLTWLRQLARIESDVSPPICTEKFRP